MFTKQHYSWLVALILLLLASSSFAQQPTPAANLMFVFGTVSVERDTDTLAGARGMALFEGDLITTADGASAQIRFTDNSLMAIRPDSQVRLTSYRYDPADAAAGNQQTDLLRGGLRAITGAIGSAQPQAVEFTTPVATMGIRGTELRIVHVLPGRQARFNNARPGSYLQVNAGLVSMSNPAGEQLVSPGQSFYVPDLSTRPQPLPPNQQGVFADDAITEEQQDDDEQQPAAVVLGNGGQPAAGSNTALTPPEQAQQDQGQQQVEDLVDEFNPGPGPGPGPDPDPDPDPDPSPELTPYGINSTAWGFLQRNENFTSTVADNGELRALTGSWYSFAANSGASAAFAQQLNASDWHPGAESTYQHGYWAPNSYTLTPVQDFTGAADYFHYLIGSNTLASFSAFTDIGQSFYAQHQLQFALQPNYGIIFSDGSQLDFSDNGVLTVDFMTNAVQVDLEFSYLDSLLRQLQGITTFTQLYSNGMVLSELGSNPIVQQGRLFGSFAGSAPWGIDAFLAGIYLRIAHNGSNLDGWGTMVFGNDCRWNFPCRVLDTDYRSMRQLGWNQGVALAGNVDLSIYSGAGASWLATSAGAPTGALLGQRGDSSTGRYQFLATDSSGLVGGDQQHRLVIETTNGPLDIYWGYWQGGSYSMQLIQGGVNDYTASELDNSSHYHFVFANQRAPAELPQNVSFSYQLAGGMGLVGDSDGTQATATGANLVVDFTSAEVLVLLLFDVGGEAAALEGVAAISDLLSQTSAGMSLVGEGVFTSGTIYGQFVGGDFEALLALLHAISAEQNFRGSLVFSRQAEFGDSWAELGFANAGMLGSNGEQSLLSNAENTRIYSLANDAGEWIPTQQIGSQGRFDLIQALSVDDDAYWNYDLEVEGLDGQSIGVRLGAFLPGSYLFTDTNNQQFRNDLPYYFAISDSLTAATTALPSGAIAYELGAATMLDSFGSEQQFDWYGQILVNFDTNNVGFAIQTVDWDDVGYGDPSDSAFTGMLVGNSGIQELFSGDQIELVGSGYWQGGGGSIANRFIGQQFDAIMALITAYTAEREQIFQGAGVFAANYLLQSMSNIGAPWNNDGLLASNGLRSWQAGADSIYVAADSVLDEFVFPTQIYADGYALTIADTSYSASRIYLYNYFNQPGVFDETDEPLSVQWSLWQPGSYFVQQQQTDGSWQLVENEQPLLYMLASSVTAAGTTPLTQQQYFSLYHHDGFNYYDDNVDETGSSLYVDGAGILVDFTANLVSVSVNFGDYNYGYSVNETGYQTGLLYGSSSVAALYSGDAIELTGEGVFSGGGGNFWGQFIGNNHQGVMAMLNAWFAEEQQRDALFGMMLFTPRPVDSLNKLGWDGGGILAANADTSVLINPSDALVVRLNQFSDYYDYAQLLRFSANGITGQRTSDYSGYFDRLWFNHSGEDIEVRWGYWNSGGYRFIPPSGELSNNSDFWFIGADSFTDPLTTAPSSTMNFGLYTAQINTQGDNYNSYLYTNGGGLMVDFSNNTVAVNLDFFAYDYGANSDIPGNLSGTGSVNDLFTQNWIALEGTGLFENGGGELAGRFIGSNYQGVISLLRAWTDTAEYSGALLFSDYSSQTTTTDWGYWEHGNTAVSGLQAPNLANDLSPQLALQQQILQQLQHADQAAQRAAMLELQNLANDHPLRPARLFRDTIEP